MSKLLGEIWYLDETYSPVVVRTMGSLVAIVFDGVNKPRNSILVANAQKMYDTLTAPGMERGKALADFWKLRHVALKDFMPHDTSGLPHKIEVKK